MADVIINALIQAIPFYLSSVPMIVLNMYIIKKKREISKVKFSILEILFTLALMLSVIFVLSITIGNNSGIQLKNLSVSSINFNAFSEIKSDYLMAINGSTHAVINSLGNVAIFIPFGVLISCYLKEAENGKLIISIIAIAITFGIETIQFFTGRYCDMTDIVYNILGIFIGYLIFKYFYILYSDFFNKMHFSYSMENKEVKALNLVQVICCCIILITVIIQ